MSSCDEVSTPLQQAIWPRRGSHLERVAARVDRRALQHVGPRPSFLQYQGIHDEEYLQVKRWQQILNST